MSDKPYKLFFFEGRNTGIAARSVEEARKKKKRGGDKLVAVRTPSAADKKKMDRGEWVRTRADGKSPEKSSLGKGRGQGPPRKKSAGAPLFLKSAKDRCWAGYEPVPGKEPYSEDSCRPLGKKKAKKKKKFGTEEEAVAEQKKKASIYGGLAGTLRPRCI